jgi:hypothetical protein
MASMCPKLDERIERMWSVQYPPIEYKLIAEGDDTQVTPQVYPMYGLGDEDTHPFAKDSTYYKFIALNRHLQGNRDTSWVLRQWVFHIMNAHDFDKDTSRELGIVWAMLYGVDAYINRHNMAPISVRKFVEKFLRYGLDRSISKDNC